MQEPLARLENICKSFPAGRVALMSKRLSAIGLCPKIISKNAKYSEVLSGISLSIGRGESIGLSGPNGCGKTTLLKIIAGVYRHDSGSLTVNGRVGAIFMPGIELLPTLSAEENLVAYAMMHGLSHHMAQKIKAEVFELSGLTSSKKKSCAAFSMGMTIRFCLTVMMFSKPDLIILDETLTFADRSFRDEISKRLADVISAGSSAIIVSHEQSLLDRFCTRSVRLDKGRIVSDSGTAARS